MRECEIKFKLTNEYLVDRMRDNISNLGFQGSESRWELDFVPDTKNFDFRETGLLLRIRNVSVGETSNRNLVTLKTEQKNDEVQDNEEIEFFLDDTEKSEKTSQIIEEINKKVGISISSSIFADDDFDLCVSKLRREYGLTEVRSLVEKKRKVLWGSDFEVCIDEFPDPVGRFLEVSATNPEKVLDICEAIEAPMRHADKRTYGKIIGEILDYQGARNPRVLLSENRRKNLEKYQTIYEC